MVAVAKPIPQATTCLPATAQAAALGYPTTLLGYTPEHQDYWREPGLPFLTHEVWQNAPLGYNGKPLIWCYAEASGHSMAPRFPKGCRVNVTPVLEKKNLVIGKVYLYVYLDAETGEEDSQLGRLREISNNYLVATLDNDPTPVLWLLPEEQRKVVWNVHEVTHYVSYPLA